MKIETIKSHIEPNKIYGIYFMFCDVEKAKERFFRTTEIGRDFDSDRVLVDIDEKGNPLAVQFIFSKPKENPLAIEMVLAEQNTK